MVTLLWVRDIQVVSVPFWHIFRKPINTQFSPHAHSMASLRFHQLSARTAHDNEQRKTRGVKDPPCAREDEALFSRLFIKHNEARVRGRVSSPPQLFGSRSSLRHAASLGDTTPTANHTIGGPVMLITRDCRRATLSGFDAATDKMRSMRHVHCRQLKMCTRVKVKNCATTVEKQKTSSCFLPTGRRR